MRYRLLGNTGLRVSELFLGAMTFGDRDGRGVPLDQSRAILDRYAEAGGNVVDTAINYRGGESGRAGQHARRLAGLDSVCRAPGAVQPAPARHRARAAPDGRVVRHDGGRVGPACERRADRQVQPTRSTGGSDASRRRVRERSRPGSRPGGRRRRGRARGDPSQVAIAWARARSRAVHPIIGASRAEQLDDNLGAAAVSLPPEALDRLDAATGFRAGFPTEFIEDTAGFVFGETRQRVDGR